MFRIQLIIALLSAGYFLHALSSFFFLPIFLQLLSPQLAAAIMPLVFNGALQTYF